MTSEQYPKCEHGRRCLYVCDYIVYSAARCNTDIQTIIGKIGKDTLIHLYDYADLLSPYPHGEHFDKFVQEYGLISVIDDSAVSRELVRDEAHDLYCKLKCEDKSSDIFIQLLLDIKL